MTQQNKNQIDFQEVIQILKKRKLLILFCIFLFLIPIIYYNITTPPIYKSNTLVLFDTQKKPTSIINPFQFDLKKGFIINQVEEMKTEAKPEPDKKSEMKAKVKEKAKDEVKEKVKEKAKEVGKEQMEREDVKAEMEEKKKGLLSRIFRR